MRVRTGKRLGAILGLLVTLGAANVPQANASPVLPLKPSPNSLPLGPFAGYTAEESAKPILDVRARWTVPSVPPTESAHWVAQWIGLYSNVRMLGKPFVQVGLMALSYRGRVEYGFFWSDAASSYRPDISWSGTLIKPGDVISAEISKSTVSSRGIGLEVSDLSEDDKLSHADVSYPRKTWRIAQWVEEDPSGGPFAPPAPVTFRDVLVDGKVPTIDQSATAWMGTETTSAYVVTPFKADEFTAHKQQLTEDQLKYLELARITGDDWQRLPTTTPASPTAKANLRSDAIRLRADYLRSATQLVVREIPSVPKPLADNFATALQREASVVSGALANGSIGSTTWYKQMNLANARQFAQYLDVGLSLGIPKHQ